jgi:hypothetical protein
MVGIEPLVLELVDAPRIKPAIWYTRAALSPCFWSRIAHAHHPATSVRSDGISGVTISMNNYRACVFHGGRKQEVVKYIYVTPAEVEDGLDKRMASTIRDSSPLPWYMLYPHS